MNLNYPSRLLEAAVNEFATLPGIGQKTALRLVLHLLRQDSAALDTFGSAIIKLGTDLRYCRICNNICDGDICPVCKKPLTIGVMHRVEELAKGHGRFPFSKV